LVVDHDNRSCYSNETHLGVSERLFFNAKWAIFLLYHGENKLHSMKLWECSLCTRPTRLVEFL